MGTMCCVYGCRNQANHKFPRDKKLAKLWQLAIGKDNFQHKKHSRICSAHFKPEDYLTEGYYSGLANSRKILKKGAIPSVLLGLKEKEAKSERKLKQEQIVHGDSDNRQINILKKRKKRRNKTCCCVPQCSNSYEKNGISFHLFPTNANLRRTWETVLKVGKSPSLFRRVCSEHFKQSDFFPGPDKIRHRLKNNVIPTNKLPTDTNKKKQIEQQPRANKSLDSEPETDQQPYYRRITMDVKIEDASRSTTEEEKVECRACLQKFNSDEELISLFQAWVPAWDGMEGSIAEDMAKIASIEVQEMDRHSKVICRSCCQNLRDACIFVLQVQNNNLILRQRYAPLDDEELKEDWPKPIQLDMNVNGSVLEKTMDVEIKKEILSDDEYENTNGLDESYKEEYINLDIKIEPEELTEQKPQIIVNGTIPLEVFNNNDKTSLPNGNCEMHEALDVPLKVEPQSDEEQGPGPTDLPLECMLCTKVFNSISGLKVHVIAQHSYKSVKRKTGDDSPQKNHNNHICPTCHRSFTTSTDLIVHETCHNHYTCYGCNGKFDSFDLLAKHRKRCRGFSNAAVKPKTLEDVKRPKLESKEEDPSKMLQCSQCSEHFTELYYLNIHQEVHHPYEKAEPVETNTVPMETESLEDIFNA